MIIYSTYQDQKQTLQKLRKLHLFSQISVLTNNRIRLGTSKPIFSTEEQKIKKIQDILSTIKTITPFAFYPFTKKAIKKGTKKTKRLSDENYRRSLHIFFDIDSTLTHKGISTINRDIKSVFDQFKTHSCNLYFCTGRAYQIVKRLTQGYGFGHEYGIAENGGIILGMGDAEGGLRRTANTEPKKVRQYLMDNNIPFKEDEKQKNRRTEIVIELKSITPKTIKKAIRNSKARVECYRSKQAYHITEKGINKGTAIEKLTSNEELDVDPRSEKVIGVGDSELDLMMFEYCDEGYLVADAGRELKKRILKNSRLKNKVHWLRKSAPYSVAELYKRLFPFG